MQQAFGNQKQQAKIANSIPVKKPFAGNAIASSMIALLGGAAVGAAIVATVPNIGPQGTTERPLIEQVNLVDLELAAATLDPASKDEILRKAKTCEAPIFMMRISKASSQARGSVRIKSGTYISPFFVLSDAPQSIAVPAPAPYEVGQGNMEILGDAKDARIEMTPRIDLPTLSDSFVQPVWWPVEKKCV